MRKKFFSYIIISLLFVILILMQIRIMLFLPQNSDAIKCITIETYTEEKHNKVTVTDKAKLKEICSIMKKTSNIDSELFPGHSIAVSVDLKYIIHILYTNGKGSEYRSFENPIYLYKLINPKSIDDNSGYICGKKQRTLGIYFNSFFKDAKLNIF